MLGNIGVGKTSLVKTLSMSYGVFEGKSGESKSSGTATT